jgi:cyanate permease
MPAAELFYSTLSMEINFNTPALLFPAISLLLLAYTNRFLALANLARKLHDDFKRNEQSKNIVRQIHSLRRRIRLVRYMQGLGVLSFLGCVVTMYTIYMNWMPAVKYEFAISLLSLLASLIISLVEISQSTKALELELSDIEEPGGFFSDLIKRREENK